MPAFPEISKIPFEGPKTKNPLAFHHYNPDEVVEGQKMKDHLRFAVAYWHTFRARGAIRSDLARCTDHGRRPRTRSTTPLPA